VAFIGIEDMPEEILAEFDTGSFFHHFIGLRDVSGSDADMPWLLRKDHPSGKHFKMDLVFIGSGQFADHGTEPVTPAAVSIVTVIDGKHDAAKIQPAPGFNKPVC